MKKLLFITALSITVVFFYSCDIRNNGNKQAAIKDSTTVMVIDTAYNFGSVKEGEIVEYSFRFKNSGKNPLVILNAQASCGCTVPEKPEEPIAPGNTGSIKVKFNSDKRSGEARKTITVTSNARPEFPVLILKGTVVGKE
jgi:hypothetical protein